MYLSNNRESNRFIQHHITRILLTNKYILLDVLLGSIAEYFYELCRVLASP